MKQNQDIVKLLRQLKAFEEEYPVRMLTERRTSFLLLIAQYIHSWARVYY
jgi:hypothetical protein